MASNRDTISLIRGMHRLLGSDAVINDRTILGEMRNALSYLLKQQTDKRKLFSSPNIFTTLSCVEMETLPIAECCDFTSDMQVARSKVKFPRIGESIYGLLVQQVSSVDGLQQFTYVTPRRLSNLLKLNSPKNKVLWWMYNDYIVVSNPDTKSISVTAFFEEDADPSSFATKDCDCKEDEEDCINPLDREFKAPGFLLDAITKMVSQKLLSTYYKIKQDTTDDQRDEQASNVNP